MADITSTPAEIEAEEAAAADAAKKAEEEESSSAPSGITDFKTFIASTMFRDMMMQSYSKGAGITQSMFEYLIGFMSKFYHSIVCIPTLHGSYSIIVKPETLFIDPPSCNIIYPNMVISSSFQRNPKAEPTRVLQLTDPMSNLVFPNSSPASVYSIATIALMDYDESGNETVKKISNVASGDQLKTPLNIITEFEKDNGVRIRSTKHGEDLYLFMASKREGKKAMKMKLEEASGMLFNLAAYNLVRERYKSRPGHANLYFNPYIVPGFPMVQLTSEHESSLNVHGYVTHVTHTLSERDWTTNVSYNYTHTDTESKPGVFPIVEQEYVDSLANTYVEALGPEVAPISQSEGVKQCRDEYAATTGTLTESLDKAWRSLPSMREYWAKMGEDYTLTEHDTLPYSYFGEPEDITETPTKSELRRSESFFNPKLQGVIKGYTERILKGQAFSIKDVT